MKCEPFILKYRVFTLEVSVIGGFQISLFAWIQDTDLDSVNDGLPSYVPPKQKYIVPLQDIWPCNDLQDRNKYVR